MNESIWQALLAARLHDPPEKALVLMRTAEGHEAGTARTLAGDIFPHGIPALAAASAKRADRWASAADRAAFPSHDADRRYPAWQQVRFDQQPVIVHPLTGQEFELDRLGDIAPAQITELSTAHLRGLIHRDSDGSVDVRRTALAFWRFGPQINAPDIRNLWALLPADTRVPDHTIFDHLDLTAALSGAFAADAQDGPALLAVSLGPVQDFIAASRSTSDLWAGSHLLARIAWEAMRVVCDLCGPEAILFPRLRGVPQVDLWLQTQCALDRNLFADERWRKERTDANPLFGAALPNRFTAVVPRSRAREIADGITRRVREWARATTADAYRQLLAEAGIADDPALPGYAQIAKQLAGFPEVHWAVVPWVLVRTGDADRVEASDPALADAMRPFFEGDPPGFLGSDAWQVLAGSVEIEDGWFWAPNPGALYPALHELLERLLSATKATRAFDQSRQYGWRCALTGDAEWLTTDRDQLAKSYRRQSDTLWAKVSQTRPGWARRGEHLGALATLKRLWPTLFTKEVGELLELQVDRFVVSTHTMALAGTLDGWLQDDLRLPEDFAIRIKRQAGSRVAVPRKLARAIARHPDAEALRALPGWLESQSATADDESSDAPSAGARRALAKALGRELETYYGLLLMDGDRMGAWLSASDRDLTLCHEQTFHPQVRHALANRFGADSTFARYAASPRAASPSRHMAISEALNHFALRLAPAVIEGACAGRLIYAGGDDVLAMVPVDDLLPALAGLRAAFSGIDPREVGFDGAIGIERLNDGFVAHEGRVMRLMGHKATASAGGVIAHHQAPLGAVMRELRDAEKRAKRMDGKDAFSVAVIKRAGGALRFTTHWKEGIRVLLDLRDFLRGPRVSRRAVYNAMQWLKDLPPDPALAGAMLGYQFARQGGADDASSELGVRIARLAFDPAQRPGEESALEWLASLLQVAEFLARESRGARGGSAVPAPLQASA